MSGGSKPPADLAWREAWGTHNQPMSDENQIVVPASFVALFVEPGRSKPSATRQHIALRHEFCEDLASMLTDQAQGKLWELGVTEDEVLERILRGLRADPLVVDEREAVWVITRLAELLEWPPLPPA